MKLIKCEKGDYHIDTIESYEQIKHIVASKTKFHYTDGDLWHVVTTFEDDDSLHVVIKSWSKYKQRWCYKVENIFSFIFVLGLIGELYKDEANNFYIKIK